LPEIAALKIFPMPKFSRLHPVILLLTFFLTGQLASAQNTAVQDSLNNRLQLLTQLSQAANFEQAQVEAEGFRDFLRRNRLPTPPKAVPLISGIYKANEDDRSATRFLNDTQLDALHDPNPTTRAALLTVLVKECGRWELPELALNCQQQLSVAQDSIAVRRRRTEGLRMQQRLDSLVALRRAEGAEQSHYLRIHYDEAYLWGGGLGLLFLALLFLNFRTNDRWRKRMERRELEMDVLQANLRHEAQEIALTQSIEAVQQATATATVHDPYTIYSGSKPEQIALLIEPNRQVVMYLKSLLADRFQLETATTHTEGLHLANHLLPDLIVCDTILNGKTGIDIVRQIKLSERTNHIPVVLLTDRFGNEGKLDALRAGADAWFTRPVMDDEFDASVQRLLDARKVKHEIFSRFLHLYYSENRLTLDDPFLARTVQMIEQNLADPDFMADNMAKRLQMTKTHYDKKLKALTGKAPVQLIREMRLEKAKVLLEKRAGSPQAISELVGFSSAGTFALAFKEYFGDQTLLLYSQPRLH